MIIFSSLVSKRPCLACACWIHILDDLVMHGITSSPVFARPWLWEMSTASALFQRLWNFANTSCHTVFSRDSIEYFFFTTSGCVSGRRCCVSGSDILAETTDESMPPMSFTADPYCCSSSHPLPQEFPKCRTLISKKAESVKQELKKL